MFSITKILKNYLFTTFQIIFAKIKIPVTVKIPINNIIANPE